MDCDYIKNKTGDFYIVQGYWNNKVVRCIKVFEKTQEGDRLNSNGFRYKKVITERWNPEFIQTDEIMRHFVPRQGYKENKNKLDCEWKEIRNAILDLGIKERSLGILGSNLIGFPVKKDVDFIIYGINNYKKAKEGFGELIKKLGFRPITNEHVEYQTRKFTQHHDTKSNTFPLLLKNKWSSIQVRDGVLSTVRFGYNNYEIPENRFVNKKIGNIVVEGIVTNSDGANFCPRYFNLEADKIYKVATYFWAYQSCVHDNLEVRIHGTLRKNDVITIDRFDQGIEVLHG